MPRHGFAWVPILMGAAIFLITALALGGLVFWHDRHSGVADVKISPPPFPVLSQAERNIPVATSTDLTLEQMCAPSVAAQTAWYQNDSLAKTETFAKYHVTSTLQGFPAAPNVNVQNNDFAHSFRTRIREAVAAAGVNFAGTYTLANFGYTGSGTTWFIVDRQTGTVYPFPYAYTGFVDFRKDSNLIVVNPKQAVLDFEKKHPESNCGVTVLFGRVTADLRAFYFLWQNNQIVFLGPTTITPDVNSFWASQGFPPLRLPVNAYTFEGIISKVNNPQQGIITITDIAGRQIYIYTDASTTFFDINHHSIPRTDFSVSSTLRAVEYPGDSASKVILLKKAAG